MSLESKIYKIADKLLISEKQQDLLERYYEKIKEHNFSTYEHCARVALKGVEVAESLEWGINAGRALYYGGLLHDLGKINIDRRILDKKDFDSEDMDKIKPHVMDGYIMLKEDFPFSALICLKHHSYQVNGYPKIINPDFLNSKIKTNKLDKFSKTIALLDYNDAINHRKNNKSDIHADRKKVMQKMHDNYRDVTMSKMINLFYMMVQLM